MKLHQPYHEACDDWHEPGDCSRDREPSDAFASVPVVDDTPDSRCELCGLRSRTVGGLCLRCRCGDNQRQCENCGAPSVGSVCNDCRAHTYDSGAFL